MTTAIAQFMRELERAWDAHRDALLVRRDLAAALAPLAAEPSVVHIPAMTGAAGRPALERFYADQFLPHVPGDLALSTISRTVDRWRLVEETTVSFTHDRVLPWLLPGIKPDLPAGQGAGHRRRRIRAGADPIPADPLGSCHPSHPAGHRPRDGYWPSSQRPGAMSSRASVGPQEPGAYGAIGGGVDSSGSTTFHAAASPSGRVYSERSPISTSWISRT